MLRNCYSFKELKEKFGWETNVHDINGQINYAKNRGVNIEKAFKEGSTYFRIIENTIINTDWKICPILPYYEVSKTGQIRTAEGKKLVGNKNPDGYIEVKVPSKALNNDGKQKTMRVHRLIMETFNPIQNSELYVVDHINGKRDDNRIENLRWVTQRQNVEFKDENYININENYQKLIQKYGYEGLNNLFKAILNE